MKNRTVVALTALAAMVLLAAGTQVRAATVTSESSLSTAGVGKAEVSLGDLITDAIRASAGADAAIVSASELKERDAGLPKGKISTQDVTGFVAYSDDPITIVKLNGWQIRQALERSIVIYPQKNLGFLQVSGIGFTFDSSKPAESRVTSVTINGRPIADGSTYNVAMTSSMANGALGYWKIWSKNNIQSTAKPITIPQAVEQFLSGRSSVNYATLNRITAQ